MALKYCEFEPSQHRNKRVAQFIFLDEEDDPHPLAICDVCAAKLKKMRPDSIVIDRKAKKTKPEPAPAAPAEPTEPAADASAEVSAETTTSED